MNGHTTCFRTSPVQTKVRFDVENCQGKVGESLLKSVVFQNMNTEQYTPSLASLLNEWCTEQVCWPIIPHCNTQLFLVTYFFSLLSQSGGLLEHTG